MTFNQLRTFLAVVDSGSVSEAADSLFVSPPAVSAALASLQAELGVALVARVGRGVAITAAGAVFAPYARGVLRVADEGVAAAREALDPESGRVRLAAVTTAGEHVLPRFLASFRARHPQAEVSLEVGNRERLWELLAEREVDLAIGGRPPGGARFVSRATRPNVLVLVAAARPGSNGVREVSLAELSRQVLLLREPGSGTRRTAEELFDELGMTPRRHPDPRVERRPAGVGAGGPGHHPHLPRRGGPGAGRGHARGVALSHAPPPPGLAPGVPGRRGARPHRRAVPLPRHRRPAGWLRPGRASRGRVGSMAVYEATKTPLETPSSGNPPGGPPA